MVTRPKPGPDGGWMVEVGKGPAAFGRGGFANAAAAAAWAEMAAQYVKPSTIRLGPRRLLGTMAEALRRWAIDQGTLPEAEGGTHLAPVSRLAGVMADPVCALPLAALQPEDLMLLRARRRAALGSEATMLLEQAALAAAIDALRDLYLPDLSNPFFQLAPDGLALLQEADCARLLSLLQNRDSDLARAVTLLLTTGAAPALLFAATLSQCLARNDGRLWLGGLSRPWPAGLPRPQGRPDATPLLGALDNAALARGLACLDQKLGCGPLTAEALWLTGLVLALRDGCHLDEVMVLTGLHRPGLA
ncbi:hypothetical protein EBE87_16740 [Pseudoroseomonas wenyumeiae]|uniref:Uncharacterized protein n=1 Tax=Teichococcus wenyumeiae TaxID=2478470 RepID=A0A3A9J8P0_9PROT|nr:hypothetical protein [Pseudoroseomonas wenyumeiae]RKK03647.1 hypothetical protein D6Z83_13525 [Pseudoroseomonas wenyumeiae]RMI20130.1 hypothetical protein EBE87_16740 [Pseudoroseomonas wenyumeiae]